MYQHPPEAKLYLLQALCGLRAAQNSTEAFLPRQVALCALKLKRKAVLGQWAVASAEKQKGLLLRVGHYILLLRALFSADEELSRFADFPDCYLAL